MKTAGAPLGFTVRYNPQALVAARQQFEGSGLVSIVVPFFSFNQLYTMDPIRYPQKGTAMETTGRVRVALIR